MAESLEGGQEGSSWLQLTPAQLSLLKVSCIATSALLSLAPSRRLLQVAWSGTTGSLPFGPYAAFLVDNIVGVTYGVAIRDTVLIINRVFNLVCAVTYALIYLRYTRERSLLPTTCFGLSALFLALIVFLDDVSTLGIVFTSTGVLLGVAPLAYLPTICKTKSAPQLVPAAVLASFVCNFCWTTYGVVIGSVAVGLSAAIAGLAAAVQVVLISLYPTGGSLKPSTPSSKVDV